MNLVIQLLLAGVIGLAIHKPLVWFAKGINGKASYPFERGTFMKRILETLGLFLLVIAMFSSFLNEVTAKGTVVNLTVSFVLLIAFGLFLLKKIVDWAKNSAVGQHKGNISWWNSILLGLFVTYMLTAGNIFSFAWLNTLATFLGALCFFYADYFVYEETLFFADPNGAFEH